MHECKRCGTPWAEHDGPCEDYLKIDGQAATIAAREATIAELRAEVERLQAAQTTLQWTTTIPGSEHKGRWFWVRRKRPWPHGDGDKIWMATFRSSTGGPGFSKTNIVDCDAWAGPIPNPISRYEIRSPDAPIAEHRDATITELRAEVERLRAEVERLRAEVERLRAEVERLRAELLAYGRSERSGCAFDAATNMYIEQRTRAERAETNLAEAVDIIKAFMRGVSLEPPGLFERADALLAKVKP